MLTKREDLSVRRQCLLSNGCAHDGGTVQCFMSDHKELNWQPREGYCPTTVRQTTVGGFSSSTVATFLWWLWLLL